MPGGPELVVVGSVAYDSIETPARSMPEVLGGSATYFSLAASALVRTGVVAVVGRDFRPEHLDLLARRGVDVTGIEVRPGLTFRWGGRYDQDLKERETLFTHLNVFADFAPRLPESYRRAPFLFLANIDPDLQHRVLEQADAARFVACDTMNYWIRTKLDSLLRLLPRIDALFLNDSEAAELTGQRNLVAAGRWVQDRGPHTVIIKKGEHGVLLLARDDLFALPAFPLAAVVDTTGAGDTFAGGMMGTVAKLGTATPDHLRLAAAMGTAAASLCVEEFGPQRLAETDRAALLARLATYRRALLFPPAEP